MTIVSADPHSEQAIEQRTFEAHKEELLKKAKGQYVLIKSKDIIGIYPTQVEAIRDGLKKFVSQHFSVKHISEDEEPFTLPSIFSVHPR